MRSFKGIRLYTEQPLSQSVQVTLSDGQANYLINVMRQKLADRIMLFNGKDGEWLAEIVNIGKKEVVVQVESQSRPQKDEPDIWLVFAPVKHGHIDFMVEKATELGVGELLPVFTERTIVDRVKTERLLANAIEAAELAERLTIPKIHDGQKLTKLLGNFPKDRKIMLCDESGKARPIKEVLDKEKKGKWAIIIGPEGGFTDKEFEMMYNMDNVYPVSLGPRIMRADTAALAALTIWQEHLGDWS